MGALKLYSLIYFLVYNAVLLTIDIMLHITSMDLLMIWILYILTLFAHLHTPFPNLASDDYLISVYMGSIFLKKIPPVSEII